MVANEIFARMLDYLYAHHFVANQLDLSQKTGVNTVSISRILNGRVKNTKLETLRRVNTAFGGIFNPAWLRGESDIMLTADLPQPARTARGSVCGDAIAAPVSVPTPPNAPDTPTTSSLINAALAAKDETITTLQSQLADKDALIATLREQLSDLRTQLATDKLTLTPKKGLHGGYFPMVAAEEELPHITKK